jgi:hypothetical protein
MPDASYLSSRFYHPAMLSPGGLTCSGGNFLVFWVVRRSRGRTPSKHRRVL